MKKEYQLMNFGECKLSNFLLDIQWNFPRIRTFPATFHIEISIKSNDDSVKYLFKWTNKVL